VNPLLRIGLRGLLGVGAMSGALIAMLLARRFLSRPGPEDMLEQDMGLVMALVLIVPVIVIGQGMLFADRAVEMHALASMAPIGRRRRLSAVFQFALLLSFHNALFAVAFVFPCWSICSVELFARSLLNLFLVSLAGSFALGNLWPRTVSIRLPAVIAIALLSMGLGYREAASPGSPWMAAVLLPNVMILWFKYARDHRGYEPIPEDCREVRQAPGSWSRVGRPAGRRPMGELGLREEHPMKPIRGLPPSLMLLRASYGRGFIPFWWILAMLLLFQFVPIVVFQVMFVFSLSLIPGPPILVGWDPFRHSPFPRRKAFLILTSPIAIAWIISTLAGILIEPPTSDPLRRVALAGLIPLLVIAFILFLSLTRRWLTVVSSLVLLALFYVSLFLDPSSLNGWSESVTKHIDSHPWAVLPLLAAVPLLLWRSYRAFRRMAG
jgi:hypothetical protein